MEGWISPFVLALLSWLVAEMLHLLNGTIQCLFNIIIIPCLVSGKTTLQLNRYNGFRVDGGNV